MVFFKSYSEGGTTTAGSAKACEASIFMPAGTTNLSTILPCRDVHGNEVLRIKAPILRTSLYVCHKRRQAALWSGFHEA
jgi:hypothetical protein